MGYQKFHNKIRAEFEEFALNRTRFDFVAMLDFAVRILINLMDYASHCFDAALSSVERDADLSVNCVVFQSFQYSFSGTFL